MWGVIPVSCLPSRELPELDERVLAGGQDVLPVAGEGDGGDGRAVVRLQEGRHAPDGHAVRVRVSRLQEGVQTVHLPVGHTVPDLYAAVRGATKGNGCKCVI